MATSNVKSAPAWAFTLNDEASIKIDNKSGHWAQQINLKTGKPGDAVHIYEAILTYADGTSEQVPVTSASLRELRRLAKRQAALDAAKGGAQ